LSDLGSGWSGVGSSLNVGDSGCPISVVVVAWSGWSGVGSSLNVGDSGCPISVVVGAAVDVSLSSSSSITGSPVMGDPVLSNRRKYAWMTSLFTYSASVLMFLRLVLMSPGDCQSSRLLDAML
jgi:hypothetical protein